MKKLLVIAAAILAIGALTGCGKAESKEETAVRVAALKGPTAMGMVKLMEDAQSGAVAGNNYEFSVAGSVDEIVPKLVQGEVDIAAVPANLGAVLYNTTNAEIQVMAVNTMGVLYIVDTAGTVKTVEDLRGKTIYASGKGATPEYALEYILTKNGIDSTKDVTIEWKSEHSECVAALTSGTDKEAVALLPQPFVTTAQTKNDTIQVALDLNKEWANLQQTEEKQSALITGVIVGRKAFLEENPDAVKAFMNSYEDSVEYVNGNVKEAAELVGKYDIVPAAVAQKAIPYCNIVFMEGTEMKEKLSGYLEVLFNQNPKAVGEIIPADEFYYGK